MFCEWAPEGPRALPSGTFGTQKAFGPKTPDTNAHGSKNRGHFFRGPHFIEEKRRLGGTFGTKRTPEPPLGPKPPRKMHMVAKTGGYLPMGPKRTPQGPPPGTPRAHPRVSVESISGRKPRQKQRGLRMDAGGIQGGGEIASEGSSLSMRNWACAVR